MPHVQRELDDGVKIAPDNAHKPSVATLIVDGSTAPMSGEFASGKKSTPMPETAQTMPMLRNTSLIQTANQSCCTFDRPRNSKTIRNTHSAQTPYFETPLNENQATGLVDDAVVVVIEIVVVIVWKFKSVLYNNNNKMNFNSYGRKLFVTALTPRRIQLNLQCQNEFAHFEPYVSPFDALKRIVNEEGFVSLFRGNEMLLLSQAVTPWITYLIRKLLPTGGNVRLLSSAVVPTIVVRPLHFIALRLANNYLLVTEVEFCFLLIHFVNCLIFKATRVFECFRCVSANEEEASTIANVFVWFAATHCWRCGCLWNVVWFATFQCQHGADISTEILDRFVIQFDRRCSFLSVFHK